MHSVRKRDIRTQSHLERLVSFTALQRYRNDSTPYSVTPCPKPKGKSYIFWKQNDLYILPVLINMPLCSPGELVTHKQKPLHKKIRPSESTDLCPAAHFYIHYTPSELLSFDLWKVTVCLEC